MTRSPTRTLVRAEALVLTNGRIHTMDAERRVVEEVLIENGRFVDVGKQVDRSGRVHVVLTPVVNGITPTTIVKSIDATLVTAYEADYFKVPLDLDALARARHAMASLPSFMRSVMRPLPGRSKYWRSLRTWQPRIASSMS